MGLNPNLYVTSLNFFRASSWNLAEADIQHRWLEIILARCPVVTVGGAYLMIGVKTWLWLTNTFSNSMQKGRYCCTC
jgi:hypothetical protein